MTNADCGFCGEGSAPSEMLRGGKTFICASCFSAGLTWSIQSRATPPREIPEADRPCSLCQKKTPPSALFARRDSCICASCLSRGFWFFANTGELQQRRNTWRFLDEKSPTSLMTAHFDGTDITS